MPASQKKVAAMLVQLLTLGGLLGCIGLSLGCAGQPRVVVVTSTMVGLEAKPPMGDAQPNPSVSLAYKRAEMVLIPVCQVTEYARSQDLKKTAGVGGTPPKEQPNPKCPPNASKEDDAYAVTGSFQMQHNWFGPLNIRQFIATGIAARHLITPTIQVIGEVKNPGRYPFSKDLTVNQAIALAGGRTDQSRLDTVDILRHTKEKQEKITGTSDTVLAPNDILHVLEAHWFHISGEVNTPGRYPYENGLTIEGALKAANELTEGGKQKKIKGTQVRRTDRISETRELGPKAPVLPDDIIVVEPAVEPIERAKNKQSSLHETPSAHAKKSRTESKPRGGSAKTEAQSPSSNLEPGQPAAPAANYQKQSAGSSSKQKVRAD
jgi:protein involved in polysaccharide export with SLBB domain